MPARTSSFQFQGKNEDLRTIAEKLNVSTILEGSVRTQGGRVRITAQLIKASDGLPPRIRATSSCRKQGRSRPAGPAGVIMRGRTIYVVLGIGDSVLAAPIPTRQLANPAVSSPIYSSVLAIHVSAPVEQTTSGFTLSTADQQTLAAGGRVILSNGGGDTIEIELIADSPDYVPAAFVWPRAVLRRVRRAADQGLRMANPSNMTM